METAFGGFYIRAKKRRLVNIAAQCSFSTNLLPILTLVCFISSSQVYHIFQLKRIQ